MKNIIILLFISLLITSCKSPKEKFKEKLVKLTTQQLASDTTYNDLFLHFKFGMTPKDVNKHIIKLVKNKKLERYNGEYIYNINFMDKVFLNYKPYFIFRYSYNKNKLYKMVLFPKYKISNIIMHQLDNFELSFEFMKRFNEKHSYQYTTSFFGANKKDVNFESYSIIGNFKLHILNQEHINTFISYTDQNVENRIASKKQLENENKIRKSINDF